MQSPSLVHLVLSWIEYSRNGALTRHRNMLRVLWATWLIGVVFGSLASGDELSSLDKVFPLTAYDKLMHFSAYAGLAILSMFAFERRRGVAVALSMILLGTLIEIGQRFSPGRTPDVCDAIANTLGVLTGIALRSIAIPAVATHARKRAGARAILKTGTRLT